MGTTPGTADISLGNVPVVKDFVNNIIIAAGAILAGVMHTMPGGSLIAEVTGIAISAAGFGLSAIHVKQTSWLGQFLGALTAQSSNPAQS